METGKQGKWVTSESAGEATPLTHPGREQGAGKKRKA